MRTQNLEEVKDGKRKKSAYLEILVDTPVVAVVAPAAAVVAPAAAVVAPAATGRRWSSNQWKVYYSPPPNVDDGESGADLEN